MVAGCVSKGTHTQTLADLEETRKAAAKTAAEFDNFKTQAAAETDGLTKQLEATQQELSTVKQAFDGANTRIRALEKEKEEATAIEQAAALLAEFRAQVRELTTKLEAEKAKVATLTTTVQGQEERLKAEAAEKARLEQERAAKEAEIRRLSKTQEDLTKALETEIAQGDIKIKQVRDRLTINVVDRVLFDSGQAQVKPAGLKVLKQVSDILKTVTDKQVRIEGHTDHVPIGGKLKEKFPTNWELSTARATSVVRYLIEEGGVNRATLSAVGYADTQPVAGNDTEEGRKANRRIEITLYPKDLSGIANQMKP
jgi:chemotaxis protein MotB